MTSVRFDDSLPILVKLLRATLGDTATASGTILRDAVGCLAFFANEQLNDVQKHELTNKLQSALGAYARADRVIADIDDYGARAVSKDSLALRLDVDGFQVRLVDRRVVGLDWLHAPVPPPDKPPRRVVFASLKGGVGRSTALVVIAQHLASKHGLRVLAVDLDMEAPGLGALLLSDNTVPEFGMIDALVENGLTALDAQFYADLVGSSQFTAGGTTGPIHVIPAFGKRSLQNPADVLAKIARAYAEDIRSDGTVVTMLGQIQAIIDYFAKSGDYDVILVDARAGLHESTASAILGLGAEILLFGLNEPQTFQGYKALLAHLARFRPNKTEIPEWVERLTMVQGKAPADVEERNEFVEKCRNLFVDSGLSLPSAQPPNEIPLPAGPFDDVPWNDELSDEDALGEMPTLPQSLAIINDGRFHSFDPFKNRDLLTEELYKVTFGDLIEWIDRLMEDNVSMTPQEEV